MGRGGPSFPSAVRFRGGVSAFVGSVSWSLDAAVGFGAGPFGCCLRLAAVLGVGLLGGSFDVCALLGGLWLRWLVRVRSGRRFSLAFLHCVVFCLLVF